MFNEVRTVEFNKFFNEDDKEVVVNHFNSNNMDILNKMVVPN